MHGLAAQNEEGDCGIEIGSREKIGGADSCDFGDFKQMFGYPVKRRFNALTAETLAKNQSGEGVFFRNKYGKGSVYVFIHNFEKTYYNSAGKYEGEAWRIWAKVRPVNRILKTGVANIFVSEHCFGGGCFMVELQEPSALMVVAERFTPSGRVIPEQKLHCGLGFEEMFNVYKYRGYDFEELCAKYVKRNIGASGGVERIVGPELTEKFSEYIIAGGGELELPRSSGVAVVTGGEGVVNGVAVRKGERLVFADEQHLTVAGETELIVCV